MNIEQYLSFKNGFFIEVGAHDGYTQSNTYYLEKFMDWQGILIEGIPELYEQCKSNRPKSRVINCALVDKSFSGDAIKMYYGSLMSVVDGSLKDQSIQNQHVKTGIKYDLLQSNTYAVSAPARTLESVLDEVGVKQIDFFSLDVEGYELSVLKGMNIERYKPRLIVVEARFFNEVNAFLEPYYYLAEKIGEYDCVYKLKPLPTNL